MLSLVAMLAIGLAVFGVATYRTFARTEIARVDEDLRASVAAVVRQLVGPEDPGGRLRGGPRAGPPVVLAPGTYAELRRADGSVIDAVQFSEAGALPDLAGMAGPEGFTTVRGVEGDGRWRVLTVTAAGGRSLVVATPLAPLERSLRRLVRIEVAVGGLLLALLATGAGLLLRRGLRPLEEMADTAGTIGAEDLDRRLPVEEPESEVGRLAGALNRMLDDLEAAFREREATEARLRRFLADASHELRTPLTSIRGFAELFRIGGDSEHVDLATILRRIEEESERMATLVDDLLLLARLDETAPVEVGDVDLTVLAADACSDAVAVAPDRPVTLDAPEPLVVVGNADHLRQALGNLVANAVRHTPAGTPIEVAARWEDGAPTVTVRDHGPGLDDDALAHVFDRFWRADPARAGTGAGLGLAIVAAVAAEHDGTVTAANAPGGGARFALRLPAPRP